MPTTRIRTSLFHLVTLALFTILLSQSGSAQTVSDVVSLISESSYRQFHSQIENSGLGLYAGSAYNNGSRSRRWHEPPPPNLGNLEAQIIIADAFLACPRLLVWVPSGSKQNVMAELPGEDPLRANEVYIISGHFDTTADTNRPGGDDNASGTAGVMEAARVMSQFHFGATIRFIAFNAEEGWHGGSLEYVNDLTPEQKLLTKGVVNMDMILHGRDDRTGHGNDPYDIDLWSDTNQPAQVSWMNQFVQAAATYVPALLVDPSYDNRASSDHESFYINQIPAFTLIEFDVAAWQGGANKEYHTANDYSLYQPNGTGNGYLKDLHWSFPFATNVVKASVALVAEKAGIAPEVFDVEVSNIGIDSATVTWKSRYSGNSYVEFGLTPDFGQTSTEPGSPGQTHSVTLTGLQPQAQYYYRAVTEGPNGPRYSKTGVIQLLKVPVISGVAVETRTNTSAVIVWSTDTVSSSQVAYGLTTAYGSQTPVNPDPVLFHRVTLTGLSAAATYQFKVISQTVVGQAASENFTFTTLTTAPGVDGTPPSTPTGVSTLIYSPEHIKVSWAPSSDNVGVTGYDLYTSTYLESTSRTFVNRYGLSPNTQYSFRVAAYDDYGNRSAKSAGVPGTTKSRPPSAATVTADQQPGVWLASPDVNFTAVGGFGAGTVQYYAYRWTTSPTTSFTGSEPVWGSAGLSVEVPPDGQPYYLHLAGFNSAGYENGRYTIGPFQYDPTPPTVSAPEIPRRYIPAGEPVSLWWSATDAQSGVSDYQYRIADAAGTPTGDWTDADGSTVDLTAPVSGASFRVQVRSRNASGLWSDVAQSEAMTAATRVAGAAAARLSNSGSAVIADALSITSNHSTYIYAQEPGMYTGVRVACNSALPIGRSVSIGGIVESQNGETVLVAGEAVDLGADAPVSAVRIISAHLGGADLSPSNLGVDGSLGPHNVGILVELLGKVTQSNPGLDYVYIQDASETTDETGLGVPVLWTGAKPSENDLIRVWAISHFKEVGASRFPALILQSSDSFEVL